MASGVSSMERDRPITVTVFIEPKSEGRGADNQSHTDTAAFTTGNEPAAKQNEHTTENNRHRALRHLVCVEMNFRS